MSNSEALLPVIFQQSPLSDSPENLRRRPIKVHVAVYSGFLFIALYVVLIVTHDGSARSYETARNNTMLSWQRTAFHFKPEKNWMNGNDMNGPLFYKGWYHLFYQYNPDVALLGHMNWGHAVSKDLIHWLYLPLAMSPDQWYDTNGVRTGSATFLDDASNIPDNPSINVEMMSAGLRYDYGQFYASKTFYDHNKGRRILWGLIGESDSEAANVQKGWSSVRSIPRTIVLDTKTRKNLVQWPVEEFDSLRLSNKEFDMMVKPETIVPVDVGLASQLDIEAEFEIRKEDLDLILGDDSVEVDEEFSCETSAGSTVSGALGPFGFSVLADQSLSEQTSVYFYVTKGKDSELKTFFCTDTLRSTLASDVVKSVYGSFVPVLKGEKLTMRILVDHSIVEGFGQGGRTCITSRVYPTTAIYEATKLFLFNNALNATVTTSFKIWQINSAFIHPYSVDDLHVPSCS